MRAAHPASPTRLWILLALLPVSPGCRDDGGGSRPAFEPLVVFRADRNVDETYELFSADANGKVVNLSGPLVAGGDVLHFVWSPDRAWVAFVADKEVDGQLDLYAVPSAGGTPTRLNQRQSTGGTLLSIKIEWAPDSSRIAYSGDGDTAGVEELYTVRPDGTGHAKVNGPLAAGGDVGGMFLWAPDSSRIAYLADQDTDGVDELYISLPDGTGNVKVNGPLVAGGDVQPFFGLQWAPDSSAILYVADQDTDEVLELYVSLPNGTENVRINGPLATGGDVGGWVSWSPDSSRIAYVADQETDDVWELYPSRPDGTDNRKVNGPLALAFGTIVAGDVFSFAWAPDGSRIAYLADQDTDGVNELYTSLPDGTGNVRVNGALVAGGNVMSYAWSPDGSRIAYVADQSANDVFELYASLPDGTGNVKLSGPVAAGGDVDSFTWSPDGARVAYRADQEADEVFELYAAPADGSSAAVRVSGTLASGGDVLSSPPRWSSDSAWIVYVADQETDATAELFASPADGAQGNRKVSGTMGAAGGNVATFAVR